MNLRAAVLICILAVAWPAAAADLTQLTAQRQKQFDSLATQRTALLAEHANVKTQLLAHGSQISLLEANHRSLDREFAGLRDVSTKGLEGFQERQADRINDWNKDRRKRIQSEQKSLVAQANRVRAQMQATRAALQTKVYRFETSWMDVADRFGRCSQAEHQAALPQFDGWIAADDNNSLAFIARALAHAHLGQTVNALSDVDKAIAIATPANAGDFVDPVLITAYCVRAKLRLNGGTERDVAKEFGTALSFDNAKNHIDSCLFQGVTNCIQAKYPMAETKFKLAVGQYPNEPEGHRLLGLLYATCDSDRLRNGKKAVASAQKSCDLTKNLDWACMYALAAAQAEDGDFAKAAQLAAQASDLTIDEHRAECLRCQLEYEQQRPLRLQWK